MREKLISQFTEFISYCMYWLLRRYIGYKKVESIFIVYIDNNYYFVSHLSVADKFKVLKRPI